MSDKTRRRAGGLLLLAVLAAWVLVPLTIARDEPQIVLHMQFANLAFALLIVWIPSDVRKR